MNEYFVGELRLMAFTTPPKGWALCNGQLLAISSNQALFSLLGTTFGGDGRTTFALPNLQGRVAIGMNAAYPAGTMAGEEMHTLFPTEVPVHTHMLMGSNTVATTNQPGSAAVAEGVVTGTDFTIYGTGGADRAMNAGTLSTVGGQSHENRQPYLVMNYCVSLAGLFPSRN